MNKRWITRLLPLLLVFVLISSSNLMTTANFIADLPPPGTVFAYSTSEENSPTSTIIPCDPNQDSDISIHIINSSPVPPEGYEETLSRSTVPLSTTTALPDFPAYSWVFGCGAVSAAMIAGYYDRNGFHNMYPGPTNDGMMPLTDTAWPTWIDSVGDEYPNNPLVASKKGVDGRLTRGTIDNYWVSISSSAPDPFITYSWPQHIWGTAIGDFTKTSQSNYNNTDGQSVIYTFSTIPDKLTCSAMENFICNHCNGQASSNCDITYGRKLFYEARGYTVTDCYNQTTDNRVAGGFSFEDFKAEIDAGHPVFIHVTGHFMVGYGYSGNDILIRDTWSNDPNKIITMPWGGSYKGMTMRSVGIVRPAQATTTDIYLNNIKVTEGLPKDYVVGVLTTVTEELKNTDTHTYSLAPVDGCKDSPYFKVQGNQLLTNQAIDKTCGDVFNIQIRSTCQQGNSKDKAFTIFVNQTDNFSNAIYLPLILR